MGMFSIKKSWIFFCPEVEKFSQSSEVYRNGSHGEGRGIFCLDLLRRAVSSDWFVLSCLKGGVVNYDFFFVFVLSTHYVTFFPLPKMILGEDVVSLVVS